VEEDDDEMQGVEEAPATLDTREVEAKMEHMDLD